MQTTTIDSQKTMETIKKYLLQIARWTSLHLPVSMRKKQKIKEMIFFSFPCKQHPTQNKQQIIKKITFTPKESKDIIILSVIDWHFRKQRPQKISIELAKLGYRIIYVSSDFSNNSIFGYNIENVFDGIFSVKINVRGAPSIYYGPASSQASLAINSGLSMLERDLQLSPHVKIIHHPYWNRFLDCIQGGQVLYDCMDLHSGFNDEFIEIDDEERKLIEASTLTVVTSSVLADHVSSYSKSVATIRNACDYESLSERPENIFTDDIGRKIIGYHGAIENWFDLDIIKRLSLTYPDCIILLVGRDGINAKKKTKSFPNIKFVGEVENYDLGFYIHSFDVGLVPFKKTPLTVATNPVKVYEYLAAGKPVVSVDIPEMQQFNGLVLVAEDEEEFVRLVGEALHGRYEDNETKEKRKSFASSQTWKHRALEFESAIRSISNL